MKLFYLILFTIINISTLVISDTNQITEIPKLRWNEVEQEIRNFRTFEDIY